MIGVARTVPNWPGLVIVNVPPWTSSGRELLRARALRQVGDRRCEALQVQALRLLYDRHDQTVFECDRDPEVHVVVVDQVLAVDGGVQDAGAPGAH